jgi:soluble lytic murein transglycosylase-like protein
LASLKGAFRTLAVLAIVLCAGLGDRVARAQDPGVARWQSLIADASRRFEVPQSWIASVMKAESGGRTELGGRPITSAAGAMGLMQLMPDTWAALRSRYALGADPYDPHDNIFAGAAYLGELYRRFGYPQLFAAYNAGPARLSAFLDHGRDLPAETWNYIAGMKVDESMPLAEIASPLAGRGLFYHLGGYLRAGPDVTRDGLFVPLRAQR